MSLLKKALLLGGIFILLLLSVMYITATTTLTVKADTDNKEDEFSALANEGEGITPYGLFTSLTLTIDGSNGSVFATAKNSFTLFPATVAVVLELYSSDTYQDSYTNMKLESKKYTNDLDMGNTLTAIASTNGVQRYWKGRMYYKIDSKDWQEKVTSTWLFDADGILVL